MSWLAFQYCELILVLAGLAFSLLELREARLNVREAKQQLFAGPIARARLLRMAQSRSLDACLATAMGAHLAIASAVFIARASAGLPSPEWDQASAWLWAANATAVRFWLLLWGVGKMRTRRFFSAKR